MLKLRHLAFLSMVCCAPAFGQDSPPSEASIRQLLELSHADKLIDTLMNQMGRAVNSGIQAATRGKQLLPEDQKSIDDFQAKWQALFRQELSMDKLTPIYIKVYQKTFTQKEIDDVIAFYKTPSGQAMINKLPLVMQNTMAELKGQLDPLVQKVGALEQQMVAEIKAHHAKSQ